MHTGVPDPVVCRRSRTFTGRHAPFLRYTFAQSKCVCIETKQSNRTRSAGVVMKRIASIFILFLLVQVKLHAQDTTLAPLSPDEQLAVQYYQAGDYDKAVVYYEKLYNKNPIQLYYSYYLNCLILTKNYKKAEKTVKKQQDR